MNATTEVYTILSDCKTTVPATYYDSIQKQITEVLEYITLGTKCTAIELCGGQEYWGAVAKNRPTLAGKCIVDMVKIGKLPLEQVGCEHDFPRKYRKNSGS